MKALRRSMKGGDKHKPSPSIGSSKAAVAIVPPKKVIRANDDYQPDEAVVQSFAKAGVLVLGFSKGDFFHVIGREDDPHWYEACNPALPDARGVVPVSHFQVLGRTERDSTHSDGGIMPAAKNPDHDSGYGESAIQHVSAPPPRISKPSKVAGTVYAKVRYTFTAHPTRPDELSAEQGENLIIIAQSNHEWVVAKPIMRLGGPGLIPLDFIFVFDEAPVGNGLEAGQTPVQDAEETLRNAGVPSVEEWKKMAAQYKNSSITLGKFDGAKAQQSTMEQGMGRLSLMEPGSRHRIPGQYHSKPSPDPEPEQPEPPVSQLSAPVWARIPRFCYADYKYWFAIETELEDGRCWELSRYYQDFYDFQIALLAEFPAEAGNTGMRQRTLPYMPGPVSFVTDSITEGRLYNLDAYVKNLLNQPPHIARCDLVKLFFAPREGDYEIEANIDGYSGPLPGSAPRPVYPSTSNPPDIKIKLRFNGEVFAMIVSLDVPFVDLYCKIRERLKVEPDAQMQLCYQDEPTGRLMYLLCDDDLNLAIQRNEKLSFYVEVA